MRFDMTPNKAGDKRIKTRFLFLPKQIDLELRWWETSSYEQIWMRTRVRYDAWVYGWEDTRWVDKYESEEELDNLLEEVSKGQG